MEQNEELATSLLKSLRAEFQAVAEDTYRVKNFPWLDNQQTYAGLYDAYAFHITQLIDLLEETNLAGSGAYGEVKRKLGTVKENFDLYASKYKRDSKGVLGMFSKKRKEQQRLEQYSNKIEKIMQLL